MTTVQIDAEVREDGKTICPECKKSVGGFGVICHCERYWSSSKHSKRNPITDRWIPYCYVTRRS